MVETHLLCHSQYIRWATVRLAFFFVTAVLRDPRSMVYHHWRHCLRSDDVRQNWWYCRLLFVLIEIDENKTWIGSTHARINVFFNSVHTFGFEKIEKSGEEWLNVARFKFERLLSLVSNYYRRYDGFADCIIVHWMDAIKWKKLIKSESELIISKIKMTMILCEDSSQ